MIQPATLTTEFGDLRFVPYDADQHLPDIYRWVTQAYARFWGLNDSTVAQVDDEFKRLLALPDYQIFVGLIDDRAECLVEYYNPAHDDIGQHYPVRDGDQGMHILLSPPDQPRHGFSRAMFTAVMEHLFLHDSVRRIVVEPDLNNARIHRLNLQAGFRHVAKVNLGHKQALLGFCEREDFAHSKTCPATPDWHARLQGSPETAAAHLQPALWQEANDHLAAKLLREAIHEQLLTPLAEVDEPGHWQVTNKAGTVRYSFRATRYALDHWQVDGRSIRTNDLPQATDVMKMILALADDLGIPAANLPTYLEEIAATLAGLAWKYQHKDIPAAKLAKADFQTIEAGMTEGHPVFVANNGRIGFTAADFRAYAPECGEPVKLLWLAARRSRSVFASVRGLSETDLMAQEFDLSVRLHWQQMLCDQGVSPDDYLFIPVHPWQWHNKLNLAYAADLACQDLILLGEGPDNYQAQQSIRTFYNRSVPGRSYVKTALSVLNMGFMRGLSADYMAVTPAINDWLADLVAADDYLNQLGMGVLKEIAGVGYRSPYFSHESFYDNPYRKMLAGLWRENPSAQLEPGERLMTMAALLHKDRAGQSLAAALIRESGLEARDWLTQYLYAYLMPVLHCFYAHRLVYMPHGENVILVIRQHTPVRALMKDLGEEITLLNDDRELPEAVKRIAITLPEDMEILSIFTDLFDGIFRYLSPALAEEGLLSESDFWATVAACFVQYREDHKDNDAIQQRLKAHDPFMPRFANSCLNRLQLRNNQKMVDLADPASSLQLIGELENPIAGFRPADW